MSVGPLHVVSTLNAKTYQEASSVPAMLGSLVTHQNLPVKVCYASPASMHLHHDLCHPCVLCSCMPFTTGMCHCCIFFSAPCEGIKCGSNAICEPNGVEAMCMCKPGWTYDPVDISAGCVGKWCVLVIACPPIVVVIIPR